eukprot:2909843-Rhodomonas_salina.1
MSSPKKCGGGTRDSNRDSRGVAVRGCNGADSPRMVLRGSQGLVRCELFWRTPSFVRSVLDELTGQIVSASLEYGRAAVQFETVVVFYHSAVQQLVQLGVNERIVYTHPALEAL